MGDEKWEVDVLKGLALYVTALLGLTAGALGLSFIAAIIAKLLGA